MATIELTPEHGYLLVAVLSTILVHHFWMSFQVVGARKKYKVGYPTMYADKSNKDAKAFNCVQRAHQNSLENQPAFLVLLLLAGARYPISASVAAGVYLLGRVAYFLGYSTGNPEGRYRGAFMYLGQFALMGMVWRWALELLWPLVGQFLESLHPQGQ